MESQPEKWRYGVQLADQPKLQPLLEALERLRSRSLTAAMVVVAFHRRRVLPLMARRRRLFEMTPDEPIDGIRMSIVALPDEEILRRVRETVEGRLRRSGLTPFRIRPSRGYISLVSCVLLRPSRPSRSLHFWSVPSLRLLFLQGMRDVRASPPPVPEDAERRAENRAHAEEFKERKDAEEARRKKKSLERDELEKRRR